MAEYTIRPAAERDAEQLAAIKSSYVRSLYRGFLSAGVLKGATVEYYLPEIAGWIKDRKYHVDALECDGQMMGFIVYGADQTCPGFGLIREEAVQPACGRREKDALAHHAIGELTAMGFHDIHLWVLRDNFRVRFLYESIGFRPDGAVRVEPRDNLELNISRYVYHLPASGE